MNLKPATKEALLWAGFTVALTTFALLDFKLRPITGSAILICAALGGFLFGKFCWNHKWRR